jgi:alkylation response protein AidB-like acyl-CoA dehydrogenase
VPIAFTEEQRGLQASIRDWAELAALGVFSIALPAKAAGAGGTVTDLAAALEQLTCAMLLEPLPREPREPREQVR